jgi:hypothetical protein
MSKERTTGQTIALMVVSAAVSAVVSSVVFYFVGEAKERARLAPLPGPIAPGQGSA